MNTLDRIRHYDSYQLAREEMLMKTLTLTSKQTLSLLIIISIIILICLAYTL